MKARNKIIILILAIASIVSGCVGNKYQDPIVVSDTTGFYSQQGHVSYKSEIIFDDGSAGYKNLINNPPGWYTIVFFRKTDTYIAFDISGTHYNRVYYISNKNNKKYLYQVDISYGEDEWKTFYGTKEAWYSTFKKGIIDTINTDDGQTFTIEFNPNTVSGYYYRGSIIL